MNMKRGFTLSLPSIVLLACTPPTALDDEAGVTTGMEESSETGDTTSSESASESFEPGVDLPPLECDFWAQDCPEGHKCVAYSSTGEPNWDAYKCVPVMGDQHEGEACWWGGIVEATDDCDAGSYCFDTMDVDGQLVGTCYLMCTGTPLDPQCPPESYCSISGDGVLNLCIPTCDPLAQDCAGDEGCYWTGAAFTCLGSTMPPAGEPCAFINDCVPGEICIDAASAPTCGGSGCCTSFCDLQLGDAQCASWPDFACVPFFEEGMALPGYENVGVCMLPP
jgi:hypothetical protein